jgi:hypothetical protein
MPEHRIRLRGPWISSAEAGTPTDPSRISLPIAAWPDSIAPKIRLSRHFGRPRIDPTSQSLRIELRQTAGVTAAWLNGQRITIEDDGGFHALRGIGPLLERNELALEVDTAVAREATTPWGEVALVIVDEPSAGSRDIGLAPELA